MKKNINKKKNILKRINIYLKSFIFIFVTIDLISVYFLKENNNNINQKNQIYFDSYPHKTNINLSDEFFEIKGVYTQIIEHNFHYINTIKSDGKAKIGNALIVVNNLINICEKIRCKNIIIPDGLQVLIKRPIFYEEYNITIFPNSYNDKIEADINLTLSNSFSLIHQQNS